MKVVLWTAVALFALAWTGGAALLSQLVQWAAQGIAAPGADSVGAVAAAATLPGWLSPWFDPAAWNAAVQAVAGMVTAAIGTLPMLGEVVSWLAPAVWVVWGLGLMALLAAAGVGHWWVGRMGRMLGGRPSPIRV